MIKSCFTSRSSTHLSSSLQLPTKVADLEISSRTLKHRKANHITCRSQLESVLPRAWTTVSSLWKFHILKQCSDIKCHVPMSQTGFLLWKQFAERCQEATIVIHTSRVLKTLAFIYSVWAWPYPGNWLSVPHWLPQTWSLLVDVYISRCSTRLKGDTEAGVCSHWHGDSLSGSDSTVREFSHAPTPLSLPCDDQF